MVIPMIHVAANGADADGWTPIWAGAALSMDVTPMIAAGVIQTQQPSVREVTRPERTIEKYQLSDGQALFLDWDRDDDLANVAIYRLDETDRF